MYDSALFNQITCRKKNSVAKISEYLPAGDLNKNNAFGCLTPMMNTHPTFSLQPSARLSCIISQVSHSDAYSNSKKVIPLSIKLGSVVELGSSIKLKSVCCYNHKQKVADHHFYYKNSFHMSSYHLNPYYLNPSLTLGEI